MIRSYTGTCTILPVTAELRSGNAMRFVTVISLCSLRPGCVIDERTRLYNFCGRPEFKDQQLRKKPQ